MAKTTGGKILLKKIYTWRTSGHSLQVSSLQITVKLLWHVHVLQSVSFQVFPTFQKAKSTIYGMFTTGFRLFMHACSFSVNMDLIHSRPLNEMTEVIIILLVQYCKNCATLIALSHSLLDNYGFLILFNMYAREWLIIRYE